MELISGFGIFSKSNKKFEFMSKWQTRMISKLSIVQIVVI